MTELLGGLALWVLPVLFAVGMAAGFVDTLAGGGGMLTIPALFISGLPPDVALATNKLQGSFGTASACWYFIRRGHLHFRRLLPGVLACALGAALGTAAVQALPTAQLLRVIPLLLLLIAALFLLLPRLGESERQARLGLTAFLFAVIAPIGFYDGFLGPGTGSFFMLALVALRGYTLQQATIEAKLYNAATNLTSLLVFLLGGRIVWTVGLVMAAGQLCGARIASGMIIRQGNRLIRPMVVSVSVLMSLYLIARNWLHWF